MFLVWGGGNLGFFALFSVFLNTKELPVLLSVYLCKNYSAFIYHVDNTRLDSFLFLK